MCSEKQLRCAPGSELDEVMDTLPFEISSDGLDEAPEDDGEDEEVQEPQPERTRRYVAPHSRLARQSKQNDEQAHEERLQAAQLFPKSPEEADIPPDDDVLPAVQSAGLAVSRPAPAKGGVKKKVHLAISSAGPGLVVGDWNLGVTVKTGTDDDSDNETNRLRARRKEEDEAEARRRGELPPNFLKGIVVPPRTPPR